MKEFIEKLIGRLEEELKLAEIDRERYLYGNSTQFNYGKAVGYGNAVSVAIEIVNQLAEQYKGGWISVKDRLPEPIDGMLQCVIATDKNDWQGMAYYHPQKGWVFAECHNSDTKIDWTEIIAWQPLSIKYQPKGE